MAISSPRVKVKLHYLDKRYSPPQLARRLSFLTTSKRLLLQSRLGRTILMVEDARLTDRLQPIGDGPQDGGRICNRELVTCSTK